MSLALALVWLLTLPQIATASVVVTNYMQGEVDTATRGPQIYAYHQGSQQRFDVAADFDQGTYVDTEVDATGTNLQLTGAPSVGWWDTAWGHRRCFEISNPSGSTLTEHQVRVVFDSTADASNGLVQADGSDYRALAAGDATELDLWVEGGVGTTDTTVWVQLDLPPVSTTPFCLYFDNPVAATVSSAAAVFSYSSPRQLYFPTYWRLDGSGGVDGTLNVVSFVDDNDVTVDGVTINLDAGQAAGYSGVTENSVITTTGPIAGRGAGQGMDSIVPVSYAGTDLVFPTNRSSQRWTIVSPSGANAAVEIYNGTVLAWSGSVGGVAQVIDADVSPGRAGIIRSTNGVPIIATHASNGNSFADSQLVPPYFPGDDIYGVRSRYTNIGFANATTVDIYRSDGTFQTVVGSAGGIVDIFDSADRDGNGTAIRFTNMGGPTGGLQQADRDGWESTAFLPERLLENEYYLPSAAEYIAFACPTAMNVLVDGTPVPCGTFNPGYPGHGHHGAAPAGAHITSDTGEPFFAYYEDDANDDETNLFGMKSAQSYAPEPISVSGGAIEQLPAGPTIGTWTSPVIDTTTGDTNVFGLLTTIADVPVDTAVTFQVARGATPAQAFAAPFLGPDGTTATAFEVGEIAAPFAWDFNEPFLVVRLTLSTSTPGATPLVDAFGVGYDLPEMSQLSSHAVVTNGSTPDLDYVLRVWSEDPVTLNATSNMQHRASAYSSGAADARWSIEGTAQVEVVNAGVAQVSGPPVPVGPGMPQNVTVETTDMAGSSMDLVWQLTLTGSSGLVPHHLQVNFS